MKTTGPHRLYTNVLAVGRFLGSRCGSTQTIVAGVSPLVRWGWRPGTPASAMPGQVDEAVKDERLARLNALLDEQARAFNASQVGKVLPVLFERPGRHPGQLIGRSPYLQAVHALAPDRMIGQIVPVRIESAARMSLGGVLADQLEPQDEMAI